MIAWIVGVLLQIQAPPPSTVQAGSELSRDTVTIGQHFTLTARIRAPRGTTLQVPEASRTPKVVDTARAVVRRDTIINGTFEATVVYTLAAWDTGSVALDVPDVMAYLPSGEVRAVLLTPRRIYVQSVLPADTTLHVPKPLRPLISVAPFPSWLWWIALAAFLLALFIIWRWRRWRAPDASPVVPLAWAEEAFRRVEALQLIEKGEPDRHATLMVDVLRRYLVYRLPAVRMSQTTQELEPALAPLQARERIVHLLRRSDQVKFAREHVSSEDARHFGEASRTLVRDVEQQFLDAASSQQEAA